MNSIILRLRHERIRAKLVTGSIIQTIAFRNLIHAADTERVVSMIMVNNRLENTPGSADALCVNDL
jgi:hypothetical protein